MLRFAVLGLLVACTSGLDIGEGTPLPGCQVCSPGAVRAGRIYSSLSQFAANRTGTIVASRSDGIAWLGDDFTVEDATPFYLPAWLAIDDAGGIAVVDNSSGSGSHLFSLAPDHRQRWSVLAPDKPVASSEQIVVQVQGDGDTLFARRVADGSLAWQRSTLDVGDPVTFAPDGTLITTGFISGTVGIGGAALPLVPGRLPSALGSRDAFVAALDPLTGEARWATRIHELPVAELEPEPWLGKDWGNVPVVGVGPAGEIAVWNPRSGVLTLLDATGTQLRQWRLWWPSTECPGPDACSLTRVVLPDGDRVLISDTLCTDFIIADPNTQTTTCNSTVTQYSATGRDWERAFPGSDLELLTLADGRLLAEVPGGPAISITVDGAIYPVNGVGREIGAAIVELMH